MNYPKNIIPRALLILAVIGVIFLITYPTNDAKNMQKYINDPSTIVIGAVDSNDFPITKDIALKYAMKSFQNIKNHDIWQAEEFWIVGEPGCKGGCKRIMINKTTGKIILTTLRSR